ncbi:MAG: hypothetical protein QXT43_01225 [Candidatus Micrarchaeaceae archaeon]
MLETIEIPSGISIEINQEARSIKITGKLGSTTKRLNSKLLNAKLEGSKLVIETTQNKRLEKKAVLAQHALASEIKRAVKGVQEGITRRMRVVFAHFPISFEIKDGVLYAKNVFGERLPRKAKIIGDTKVEIKGQDVFVKGVDPYDVNQTVSNLFALSFLKDKDERIFQDGIYLVREE